MFLPELSEREARAELAAIYADIRRLGGVPMVALIFRHLATRRGVLEWMWSAVGPAWRSGRLQEAAWRVARAAPLEAIGPITPAALRAWGVDADAERGIRDVLLAYNRANPENLLTILCALRLLEGRAAAPAGGADAESGVRPRVAWSPPAAPALLPPMAHPSTLPREVLDLLDVVAAPGEPGAPRVVQSLYRHFCDRPAFLAAVVTLVRMRLDDGSLDRAADAIHVAMSAEADAIVGTLSALPVPDSSIEAVCVRFSSRVIPQMIAAGRLIEEAMPRQA